MENQNDLVTPLFERLQEYGKTSYELARLKTIDKVVRFMVNLASRTVAFIVLTLFAIFLNIGLAILLGEICGHMYLGFFCVAAFYGIVGGILFLFMKNWLKRKISDSIINNFLN
jgi:Putative Actinobacterial Holin-X, holin superfamily III